MIKEANILWLSDIHFLHGSPYLEKLVGETYSQRNTRIEAYFNSISNHILDANPTHIVITGDLSFSGMEDQYTGMYEYVLEAYLEKHPNVRLICVPGNHSVNRNVITALGGYVGKKIKDIGFDLNAKKTLLKDFKNLEVGTSVFDFKKLKEALEEVKDKKVKEYIWKNAQDNKFDLFKSIFFYYQQFCKLHSIPRLENLRKMGLISNSAQYERSEGMEGVIFDKEYNLIFVCLNSANFAWGNETYEELLEPSFNNKYSEYGNLAFSNESLSNIDTTLSDFKEAGMLNENIVIGLCHHPLSWIHYSEQFERDFALPLIFDRIDIMLTGHIHVQHFKPTVYRSKTYIFESPQVLDYHYYSELDVSIVARMAKNHGFSQLCFDTGLQSFTHLPFSLEKSEEPDGKNIFNIREEFLWRQEDSKRYELKGKSSILTCFDIKGFDDEYFKYIKSYAVESASNVDNSIKIIDGYCFDFVSWLKTKKSSVIGSCVDECGDEFSEWIYSRSDSKESYYLTMITCDLRFTSLDQFLKHCFNLLIKLIPYLVKSQKSVNYLVIYLTDMQLKYIFEKCLMYKGDYLYSNGILNFINEFNGLKAQVFEELEREAYSDIHSKLISLGLSYDVIPLETYKNFVKKQ